MRFFLIILLFSCSIFGLSAQTSVMNFEANFKSLFKTIKNSNLYDSPENNLQLGEYRICSQDKELDDNDQLQVVTEIEYTISGDKNSGNWKMIQFFLEEGEEEDFSSGETNIYYSYPFTTNENDLESIYADSVIYTGVTFSGVEIVVAKSYTTYQDGLPSKYILYVDGTNFGLPPGNVLFEEHSLFYNENSQLIYKLGLSMSEESFILTKSDSTSYTYFDDGKLQESKRYLWNTNNLYDLIFQKTYTYNSDSNSSYIGYYIEDNELFPFEKIFTILDEQGRVVQVIDNSLANDDTTWYINSIENSLYDNPELPLGFANRIYTEYPQNMQLIVEEETTFWDCIESVRIIESFDFNAWFNDDIVLIEMEKIVQNNLSVNLYNTSGQKLLGSDLTNQETEIKTSGLSPGIYFLTIRSEQGISTRKLVKYQ